jgi:hypothetical protein
MIICMQEGDSSSTKAYGDKFRVWVTVFKASCAWGDSSFVTEQQLESFKMEPDEMHQFVIDGYVHSLIVLKDKGVRETKWKDFMNRVVITNALKSNYEWVRGYALKGVRWTELCEDKYVQRLCERLDTGSIRLWRRPGSTTTTTVLEKCAMSGKGAAGQKQKQIEEDGVCVCEFCCCDDDDNDDELYFIFPQAAVHLLSLVVRRESLLLQQLQQLLLLLQRLLLLMTMRWKRTTMTIIIKEKWSPLLLHQPKKKTLQQQATMMTQHQHHKKSAALNTTVCSLWCIGR